MAAESNACNRQKLVERHYTAAAQLTLAIGGSVVAIFGSTLAIGGAISDLESSPFLILAGFGLVLSGALFAKRHPAGAWAYMAVFAGTLWWSLQNTGLGGSSTLYRLIGPILMIIIIAVLMPVLGRWSGLRTVGISAALIISTLWIGIMTANDDSSADQLSATALHLSAVIGTRS